MLSPKRFDYFRRRQRLEDVLFRNVHRFVRRKGYMTPRDFFMAVRWRAGITMNNIKASNVGLRRKIRASTALVLDDEKTGTLKEKIAALTDMSGIGVPVASAVLAVCFPERYAVLDSSAWSVLHEWSRNGELDQRLGSVDLESMPSEEEAAVREYLNYQRICSRLANQVFPTLPPKRRIRALVGALNAYRRDQTMTAFLKRLR